MSIYKKGINDLEKTRNVEFVMSNNNGIYMNQTVIGENTSPYHGLFIKQDDGKDEVYLSKMVEQIKVGSKIYNIKDITTNEEKYGGAEYLEQFDRYDVPTYRYNLDDKVIITKEYMFSDDNVLCINYHIENCTKGTVNVKIMPLVTKRGVFNTKRQSMLKLNADSIKEGAKVTLSIIKKQYLYLKSAVANFHLKPYYLEGIKYNYIPHRSETKTYIEDAFVPGYFEYSIKANIETDFSVYVSLADVNINDATYERDALYNSSLEKNKMVTLGIDNNFHELKDLAISASALNYIDKDKKRFVLLKSIPDNNDKSEHLKHVIKSVEGNYILLGKYKEAYKILESIKNRIENEKAEYNKYNYYEIILMYIEALSKYASLEKCDSKERIDIYMYVRKKIIEILELDDENKILDDSYIITINGKKFLRINIYWYNALKVYLSLAKDDAYLSKIYKIAEKLKDNLIDIFFDDQNRVLKYEASEPAYANSDMLLAMDLTYPLIHDKMAMKIIDTAFKELYTPYGMRKFSYGSDKYDGYVYPYLMASFVNANLRQNGVTRATQKIAYNLVKELLFEINKKTVGSVKYKYDEKTKEAYGATIDSLTNAEVIRLYNMLT